MKGIFVVLLICAASHYAAAQSCAGRCGENDGTTGCQCNSICENYSDCCSDYTSVCLSCQDRCGEAYLAAKPCQCNTECPNHGNCCDDFDSLCDGTGSGLTNQDIIDLSEELYTLGAADFVGNLLTYDTAPPGPLFLSVDAAALSGPTFTTFLALRDNYDPYTTVGESDDAAELAEKEAFLDAVMATPVMNRTEQFMLDNNLISVSLRETIDKIFFTRYPRDGSTLGSSGFEHSFMGEIDDGKVKGFHNWVSFYEEELDSSLEYTTFLDEDVISTSLDLFMMGFDWFSYTKSISSMWIGSTPEMELALYAVCFYYKPNSLCDVAMNGVPYKIQTYEQSYNGNIYVGSAYPDIV